MEYRDWHEDEIQQLLKAQEETNTLLRRFLDRQEQLLDSNKSQAKLINVQEPALLESNKLNYLTPAARAAKNKGR